MQITKSELAAQLGTSEDTLLIEQVINSLERIENMNYRSSAITHRRKLNV